MEDRAMTANKLRPLNCELNALTRPDGCVLFSQGSTSVLAAMYGPVEVKLQNLKIDKAHVESVYRPKSGLPTIQDKIREAVIKDTCEACLLTDMHPRTMITVQLQELDDRGGLDACAINAACMALIAGAAPMKFTIAAVHCIIDSDDVLILDPDQYQIIDHKASFTFVFDSLDRDLVTVHSTGCFKLAQFQDAHTICRTASSTVFDFYGKIMTKFHNKHIVAGHENEDKEKMEE